MANEMGYNIEEQVPGASAQSGSAASRTGGSRRTMLIAGAVLGLLAVAGLAAAAVFLFALGGAPGDVPTPDPVVQPGAPQPVEEEQPAEPAPVDLKRVFTFRDIFAPLILPIPEPSADQTVAPGQPGAPDDPGVTLPDGTLFLRDIVTVDGVTAAVLFLDGASYTLAAGGEISGTPWKVQSISGSSVVMLFGDVRVTLTVGQGVVSAAK
ncbi:MAG: hypothetical protein KGZ40_09005 [Clostridiales bacterium]|nr:hypothetical protein [Clostridiales bacterium]